jgi:hypothetical protein
MKDIILGVVRHLLSAGGAVLVAKGIVDAGIVQETVGAVLTIIGFALSIFDKVKK